MKATLVFVFLTLVLVQASKKPVHHPPSPATLHAALIHQCTTSITECRKGAHFAQCEKDNGCVNPNRPTTTECKKAAIACEDALNECISAIGPDGCSSNGFHVVPPTPPPTPFVHPSPSPTPSPPPMNTACQDALNQCKASIQYNYCRGEQGCQTPDNSTTTQSPVCLSANVICRDLLTSCMKYFGPADCAV
jgi:hypothetical protein